MPDLVHQMLFIERSVEKLGRRGISREEAQQLLANHYVMSRNPSWPRRWAGTRRLMIGTTSGGRALTLVLERTIDPSDWLTITGWDSANHERKLLRR